MKLFVKRDLDGFFGLFIDNLVQLLLIVFLCGRFCGMQGDDAAFIYGRILPGAAVSLLVGNLFYAWQAHRLARRRGRDDVTALPYGINTPSLLVYVYFVMMPTFAQAQKSGLDQSQSAELAWKMGLLACLGSGIIEFAGSFVAEWVRRHTPRAALLSTLAGIAIGFISMMFALQIWSQPLIAMVPLGIVLVTLFSGLRFPLGFPGGLVAIVVGTILAWLLPGEWTGRSMAWASPEGFAAPTWSGGALLSVFDLPARQWLGFLSVIIPMGLFNVIGSLQNIESAEAAGDSYDTRSSLAMNGVGTILAACFGSCFPTTIYIGHPGWKAMGAKAGYSTLNGLVITVICLTGALAMVNSIVPIEAGVAIVLWIGVMITAQAFQATPLKHAPAVAIGLFPAIAAWGATLVYGAFNAAIGAGVDMEAFAAAGGQTIQSLLEANPAKDVSGFLLHGLIVMERGYIFTCMILAAISALLIDRRFFSAAVWSIVGAAVTLVGLAHAYQLSGNVVDYLLITTRGADITAPVFGRAYGIAVGYLALAAVFCLIGVYARQPRTVFEATGHA